MLWNSDNELFCQGASRYTTRPPVDSGGAERIFIPIEIAGVKHEAVLDTGGMYFICNANLVEELGLDYEDTLGEIRVATARGHIRGTLHPIEVRILATEGQSLDIIATALVTDEEYPWTLPPYMGFQGCLDRFRFAVNPERDVFYFGSGSME